MISRHLARVSPKRRNARHQPKQPIRAATAYAAATTLVVFLSVALTGRLHAHEEPASYADLAEGLMPAVVNISTTQTTENSMAEMTPQFPPGSPFEDLFRDFFERRRKGENGPKSRRVTSLGSGFIISQTGFVVTNNHVIEEADEITVVLHDDRRLPAEVVGRDPKTDLALLKVSAGRPLTAVPFGNSDSVRVGDRVLAIGNPFGLGNTVTAGIISARGRDIRAGPYDDFLQTDAPINRGNSGGPLFNLNGEVIGVNTAIFSPSGGSVGIGFSVPSALAQPVIDQLRSFGRTRRGWLGVRIQTVTEDIAEGLGLTEADGALVADVVPNSPAAKAGIEIGDVIMSFDGKAIGSMRELPRTVAATEIGKTVPVQVLRKGRRIKLDVAVGELDEEEPKVAEVESGAPVESDEAESLGMRLSSITPDLRQRYGIDDGISGVLVTDLDPSSAAASQGIRPGDVILEVGLEEVEEPTDVIDKVAAASRAQRKTVLLLVDREGDQRFVAIEIASG